MALPHMTIKQLDYEDFVFQFKGGEYVMSYATQKALHTRVLRLESTQGDSGWGEIVRKPTLDAEKIAEKEIPILNKLIGSTVDDMPEHIEHCRSSGGELRGLAFGLETAYLDLIARRDGKPLYDLLGGKQCDSVPEYYSASCGEMLNRDAQDWQVVQIKLGVANLESDRGYIEASLKMLTENQIILADFNGALSVESALSIISKFDDSRIIWEEPCLSLEDNSEVARRCNQPVMFDQCLKDLETIRQVITDNLAHSLCIKPAFLGGLKPARLARDRCIAANKPMRIDGPWCGHIATAAALHLAVGVPPNLIIAGCDLRQPLILEHDWGGTQHLPNHHITVFDSPGHGVSGSR